MGTQAAARASEQAQAIVVNRGEVIKNPQWLGEDEEESHAIVEALLAQGSIARKADVDSGDVTVPSESFVDEEGNLRPVEQRPPTVLSKINRLRQLDGGQPPIEQVMANGRPLVQREVQAIDARPPGEIIRELVPAARQA